MIYFHYVFFLYFIFFFFSLNRTLSKTNNFFLLFYFKYFILFIMILFIFFFDAIVRTRSSATFVQHLSTSNGQWMKYKSVWFFFVCFFLFHISSKLIVTVVLKYNTKKQKNRSIKRIKCANEIILHFTANGESGE